MNKKQAKEFLAALGIHKLMERANWVIAPCPLAPWRHSSGKDVHPSFGIRIQQGRSYYNCFSCNDGGSLEKLLNELVILSHDDDEHDFNLAKAYKVLDKEAEGGYIAQKEWQMFAKESSRKIIPWPDTYLELFQPAGQVPLALDFLHNRRIYKECINHFDIRFDLFRKTVCTPIRDNRNRLVGLRGRHLNPELSGLKYYDYSFESINNTGLVWFNEQNVVSDRPVILTEGAFDAIAVHPHYPNVLAAISASMSREKILRLERFPEVHCFFDNDTAGQIAYEKVKLQLGKRVVVRRIRYPENVVAKDPSDLYSSVLADLLFKHKLVGDTKCLI